MGLEIRADVHPLQLLLQNGTNEYIIRTSPLKGPNDCSTEFPPGTCSTIADKICSNAPISYFIVYFLLNIDSCCVISLTDSTTCRLLAAQTTAVVAMSDDGLDLRHLKHLHPMKYISSGYTCASPTMNLPTTMVIELDWVVTESFRPS